LVTGSVARLACGLLGVTSFDTAEAYGPIPTRNPRSGAQGRRTGIVANEFGGTFRRARPQKPIVGHQARLHWMSDTTAKRKMDCACPFSLTLAVITWRQTPRHRKSAAFVRTQPQNRLAFKFYFCFSRSFFVRDVGLVPYVPPSSSFSFLVILLRSRWVPRFGSRKPGRWTPVMQTLDSPRSSMISGFHHEPHHSRHRACSFGQRIASCRGRPDSRKVVRSGGRSGHSKADAFSRHKVPNAPYGISWRSGTGLRGFWSKTQPGG